MLRETTMAVNEALPDFSSGSNGPKQHHTSGKSDESVGGPTRARYTSNIRAEQMME
jgi:hypothetical protein